jgi:hypothetical protein
MYSGFNSGLRLGPPRHAGVALWDLLGGRRVARDLVLMTSSGGEWLAGPGFVRGCELEGKGGSERSVDWLRCSLGRWVATGSPATPR